MIRKRTLLNCSWHCSWLVGLVISVAIGAPAGAHDLAVYDRDIKPILDRNCGGGGCHIGEETSGLELTNYESILSSVGSQYGGPLVIAGDSSASPILDKISSDSPAFGSRMPLKGVPLEAFEIQAIQRWIDDGLRRSHLLPRGDVDGDDNVNITDAIFLLNYLFLGGEPPACSPQADSNSDEAIDLSDAVFILRFLFLGSDPLGNLSEEEGEACEEAGELSFQNIYEKVFATSCAFSSCHSTETHRADLILDSVDSAYESLVGATPFNTVAVENGMLRVESGVPENSFLLRKLIEPAPGEGNRMPANSLQPLSDSTIAAIREWILAGAPKEGTISGVPEIGDEPPSELERVPQPPVPENGMQIHLPPFSVGPRREREIFYFAGQPFAELAEPDVYVKRIDIHMLQASHHFILYQYIGSNNPPSGIRAGTLGVGSQRLIVASQQSFYSLFFPEGVGLKFNKDVKFDLNSHYVNLNGEQTLQAEVYINVFFAEPGEITTVAKPIFDFGGAINVPPNGTSTSYGQFPSTTRSMDPALAVRNGQVRRETHIYSLSSHTHRHGTHFDAHVVSGGQMGDMIFENWSWDDPLFKVYDPPLVLQPGDGLRFSATFEYNDPPRVNSPPLEWGSTSEDEMIILLGYYSIP